MLTLHIEAHSHESMVKEACRVLGIILNVEKPELKTAEQRLAELPLPVVTVDVPMASAEPKTTKRGRPRKETAPARAPEVPATQPAVVENTGSAPADTSPAAEDATMTGAAAKASAPVATTDTAATEAGPSVVAAPSADAFRAKLQDMNAHGEHGYKHVCALLEEFGFKRVKDVPPESYAALMARADVWLADQQKAA